MTNNFDNEDTSDDVSVDLGEYSFEELADIAVRERIADIETKIRTDIAAEIHKRLMPLCVCDNCPDSYPQARFVEQAVNIILNPRKG